MIVFFALDASEMPGGSPKDGPPSGISIFTAAKVAAIVAALSSLNLSLYSLWKIAVFPTNDSPTMSTLKLAAIEMGLKY